MARARRARPEDVLQRAVIAHLKARGAPGLFWWHTPNGGKRKPIEAAILKGLGVLPGIPDLCFLCEGRFYALELKADNGHPSVAQLARIGEINAAGGFASIARGLDAALKTLEAWQILRGVSA